MEFKKEYVEVVERFNSAHPDFKVEILKVIENGVHLYSIEHNGLKCFFTVCKSDVKTFENRLNDHFKNMKEEF